MEDRLDLERRIATLEEQNLAAKPLHDEHDIAIKDMQARLVRIETLLEQLVKTNGHRNGRKGKMVAAGGWMGAMGLLAALLRFLGV